MNTFCKDTVPATTIVKIKCKVALSYRKTEDRRQLSNNCFCFIKKIAFYENAYVEIP
jgi:hypothetical protein